MHSQEDKFKYYKGVLDEVYSIIYSNYNMKLDEVIEMVEAHIHNYNLKNGIYTFRKDKDEALEYAFNLSMSEHIKMRGRKDIFTDFVNVKKIIRERKIDDLFNSELNK